MLINNNYKLRHISGEHLVIMKGKEGTDMTRVISLSSSAAWLWEQLEGKEFSENDAIELIMQEYDIDKDRATLDVKKWIDSLRQNNIAE